jgi:topoisomerase-4 subunit A
LKELKKLPHRIVAAHIIHPDDTTYTIYSSKRHEESGNIKDIHLSEQYTNGSFIVDVKDFGEVEGLNHQIR